MKKQVFQSFTGILSIFGFLTLYIFTHLYLITLLKVPSLLHYFLQGLVFFLALSPFLSLFLKQRAWATEKVQRMLAKLGYLWLGILWLLIMAIVVVHLFTGVLWLLDWDFLTPSVRHTSILSLTLLMTLYGVYVAHFPQIVKYTIDRRERYGANQSLRIVHLSDLHLGYDLSHRFLQRIVKMSNALKPDLVVMTGDIMESTPSYFQRFQEDLKQFNTTHGTYAVTGNHDFYNGVRPFMKIMKESDIPVLENELIRLPNGIQLIGIHDLVANHEARVGFESNLEKALLTQNDETPSILLAHQPKNYELAVAEEVDLILCGHTHKGQIFPFRWIVKKVFEYVSGHHPLSPSTDLIISQGTGFWGPPIRLGTSSQIVQIELLY